MRGKLIIIEGTDCSGKETQAKLLIERMNNSGYKTKGFGFPAYNTPTGRIIGGPYLGKTQIDNGWFKEGADKVDPLVAALYYSADRRYNLPVIQKMLDSGYNVILDRYTFSNMAHQGGKITNIKKREEIYEWMYRLEFNLLELIKPDIRLFLHVPYKISLELIKNRSESKDQHEKNNIHLKNAERAYLEIADKYSFKTIECVDSSGMRSIKNINNEIYNYIIQNI